VSNVLDEHNAIQMRRLQLELLTQEMEEKQSRCQHRINNWFLWFNYCFQEKWAKGTKTQFKLLAQGFMAFWIFCTLILMIGRATDSELGYDPGEPFCGNATTCANLNMMNVALDRSTAAGVFFSAFWDTWAYLGDPGTHAGEETWPRRAVAFIVTMLGIFMMATVIGFISNIMIEMMEDLRTGKSAVIEENHTLLLGWTSSTVSLISEIVTANESEGGGVIVVLANSEVGADQKKKKEEIEDTIKHTIEDSGGDRGTKIVIRIGDYTLMPELAKVGVDKARAIVVQAPAGNADKADSCTLRAILSLRALQIKMKTKFRGAIIAELRDIDNQLLIQTVGGKDVLTVVSHDIIGRIMIKSARNPGLADVYEGLLGFEGAEFYMKNHDKECPEIEGLHFGDLFECFENAIPFGVHRFHHEKNADPHHAQNQVVSQMLHNDGSEIVSTKPELDYFINPPSSLVLQKGDEIVVLAEDDDTYYLDVEKVKRKKLERSQKTEEDEIPDYIVEENIKKEIILMIGWRRDVDDIIRLLNSLTGTGSELHIFSELPVAERIVKLAAGGLDLLEEDVAWKDTTHGHSGDSVEWGTHHHDNYVLMLDGVPNLRIVQWEGHPANMRDIKILNRKLAEFWEDEDDVVLTSSDNTGVPFGGRGFSFNSMQSFSDSRKPIRRMSSKVSRNTLLDQKHALKQFDSILILADERLEMDAMHSDSNVLASLLLLKDEQKRQGVPTSVMYDGDDNDPNTKKGCTITFEIVDPRTQQILKTNAAITEGSFYIISTHIVAKYLAMVAERKEIHGVLRELLGPAGAEITLVNINKFVDGHRNMTFRELQTKCRQKEAICLGYVQRVIDQTTKEFKVYRSGLANGLRDSSSEPLPKNMDEKMVFSGQDDVEKIITDLIIIKGRHHDLATLEHFGLGELASKYDYLTHDFSQERSPGRTSPGGAMRSPGRIVPTAFTTQRGTTESKEVGGSSSLSIDGNGTPVRIQVEQNEIEKKKKQAMIDRAKSKGVL
jgi:hypothetical protein